MSQSQQLLKIPCEFCAASRLDPVVRLFSGSPERQSVGTRVRRGPRSHARGRTRRSEGCCLWGLSCFSLHFLKKGRGFCQLNKNVFISQHYVATKYLKFI